MSSKVSTGTTPLGSAPIGALLRSYALPAVVGTLVNSLYNIVDRIFIGRGVGALAISGLTVTFPIHIFLLAFGVLIGVGASSRISILLGQGKQREAENLLGNAFLLSLLFSTTTVALCYLFMRPLLLAFGASEATLPYAEEYLRTALLGNIFANICFTYNSVMRASGYPRKAMVTMLIGAVLNVFLDAVFIFLLDFGIRGAALATVISMFIGMLYVLAHFRSPSSNLNIRPKYFALRSRYIWGIVSIGMAPFSIQLTSSVVTIILNSSLYEYGGDYAVGAYGIVNSFAMIVVMLMLGVSQGMQPIVGYNYGAGSLQRAYETFSLSARINMIVGGVGFLLAMFAPHLIVALFTDSVELSQEAVRAMRIVLFLLWGIGYQITVTQYFQSIGYAFRAMLLSLARQVIFLIPLLLILPRFWGLDGVWLATPVSDLVATLLAVLLYSRFVRQHPA